MTGRTPVERWKKLNGIGLVNPAEGMNTHGINGSVGIQEGDITDILGLIAVAAETTCDHIFISKRQQGSQKAVCPLPGPERWVVCSVRESSDRKSTRLNSSH